MPSRLPVSTWCLTVAFTQGLELELSHRVLICLLEETGVSPQDCQKAKYFLPKFTPQTPASSPPQASPQICCLLVLGSSRFLNDFFKLKGSGLALELALPSQQDCPDCCHCSRTCQCFSARNRDSVRVLPTKQKYRGALSLWK